MKSAQTPPLGVLDALTAGLTLAAKRPWLIAFPFFLDLVLWLAPRLGVLGLLKRLVAAWEVLARTAYSSEQMAQMGDMLAAVQTTLAQAGAELNLAESLTGHWLNLPSALALNQSSRLAFISDAVFAPVGLALDLPRVAAAPGQGLIEIGSFGGALLLVVGLWLVGQLLSAAYLHWAALDWQAARALAGAPEAAPVAGVAQVASAPASFGSLVLRLIAFNVVLGILLFLLRLPLGLAVTLTILSGSSLAGTLFVFVGGMTLWLLLWLMTACFFVSEAVVLERLPLAKATAQSFSMVRFDGLRTTGLVVLINLLVLGFRVVWGLLGGSPVGAVFAILANAYLTTGLLLAVFTYYDDLRRRWEEARAKAKTGKPVEK